MSIGDAIVFECQLDFCKRALAAGGPANCIYGMALSAVAWENFRQSALSSGCTESDIAKVQNINGVPLVVLDDARLSADVTFFSDPDVWARFLQTTDH